MEDLNVNGMMKNHHLAKSIQELSLYRFKEMLMYKSNWYDRDVVQIDRFYPSSKLCSNCGTKNIKLKLSQRTWKCNNCNTVHDRDYNAAINILNEGKRILNIKEDKLRNPSKGIYVYKNVIGLSSPKLTPLERTSLDGSLN